MQRKPSSDPSPNIRETQRLATRAVVLDTATEHFAARGFDGTSLPDIANECGARVSLIIYHFGSKRGLWEACVTKIYASVETRLDAAMASTAAQSGIELLHAAISAYIRATAAEPAFHRLLFQEAMQASERLEWLVENHQRKMSNRMIALIEEAKRIKLLPDDASPMHLKFILSGMFALPIAFAPEYRLLAEEDPNDEAFIDRHIALCLRLIGG